MIWFKKAKKEEPDWRQEALARIYAFRKIGEKFIYMGVEMTVTSHWAYGAQRYCPRLKANYVDRHGVIQNITFSPHEIQGLEAENKETR